MNSLISLVSVPRADGLMHLVELPGSFDDIESMVNAQVELNGKRVYVRMIDTDLGPASRADKLLVGMIVTSVY